MKLYQAHLTHSMLVRSAHYITDNANIKNVDNNEGNISISVEHRMRGICKNGDQ